jgi:hypothetical protein
MVAPLLHRCSTRRQSAPCIKFLFHAPSSVFDPRAGRRRPTTRVRHGSHGRASACCSLFHSSSPLRHSSFASFRASSPRARPSDTMLKACLLVSQVFHPSSGHVQLCPTGLRVCPRRLHPCSTRVHVWSTRVSPGERRVHLSPTGLHLCSPRLPLHSMHIPGDLCMFLAINPRPSRRATSARAFTASAPEQVSASRGGSQLRPCVSRHHGSARMAAARRERPKRAHDAVGDAFRRRDYAFVRLMIQRRRYRRRQPVLKVTAARRRGGER